MGDLVVALGTPERWRELVGAVPVLESSSGSDLFALPVTDRGGPRPAIGPGDRVYLVAWGRVRGYVRMAKLSNTLDGWVLGCSSAVVPTTIPAVGIATFRGAKAPWWKRPDEQPFPGWASDGIPEGARVVPGARPPALVVVDGEAVDVGDLEEPTEAEEEVPAAPVGRQALPSDPEVAAPKPAARTLTTAERKMLAAGKIQTPGGVIQINPRPWGAWLAETCSLCAVSRATGKPLSAHVHRIPTHAGGCPADDTCSCGKPGACRHCGAEKVFPRGPHGSRAPEVWCIGCGRWWDPTAQLARAR